MANSGPSVLGDAPGLGDDVLMAQIAAFARRLQPLAGIRQTSRFVCFPAKFEPVDFRLHMCQLLPVSLQSGGQ